MLKKPVLFSTYSQIGRMKVVCEKAEKPGVWRNLVNTWMDKDSCHLHESFA